MIAIFRAKSAPSEQPSSSVTAYPALQSYEQSDGQFTAWEKWILQKAKEDRDATEEKLRKQEEMEKKAEIERAECEKKKMEATAKIQAWIEQYDAKIKQQRRLQQKRDKAEEELKEEKKLEVLNKATVKFQVSSVTLTVFWLLLVLLFISFAVIDMTFCCKNVSYLSVFFTLQYNTIKTYTLPLLFLL